MHTATGKPVSTKEEPGDVDLSESETVSEEVMTGKPVAFFKLLRRNPMHPVNQPAREERPKAEKTEWSHNLQVSPATIQHTEAVFSIVRGIYGREHDDPTNGLDVNVGIWGIFLNATLRAAVHLGQDHEVNLRPVKNNLRNSVRQIFRETGKLMSEQKEIPGIRIIDFKDATWMSTSLLCEKVYQLTNAKTYIFSDSVLCVGKMGDHPIATWRSRIKWYSENSSDSKSYGETCNNTVDHRIAGVPLSAVDQQDTTRGNKVKRLIEKFENNKHKESFFRTGARRRKSTSSAKNRKT